MHVARIKKDMGKGRDHLLLGSFSSSSAIKNMVSENVSLIMWIIKDKNKHGRHLAEKAKHRPNFEL